VIPAALAAVVLAAGQIPAPASVMIDFLDNPTAYRGQTLTFAVRMPAGLRQGFREVGFPDDECRFWQRVGDPPAQFAVVVNVRAAQPRSPNARGGDPVWLTFRCEQGRADAGNVALAIRRPPARVK
jgi:hypothetical protein